MALACLASIGIFAGGLAALSVIARYKGKGPRERRRVKKGVVEEETKEVLEEQLA